MEEKILMAHGNGGSMMNELINDIIAEIFEKNSLQLDDSAILHLEKKEIVFTTDTYTITPIFFNGGDIGKLAVNGTINDLCVMGAEPLYLSCGLILEEGLKISELKKILMSMKNAADYAGVKIVTGDTKVVENGSVDKIFINTSGVGEVRKGLFRKDISKGNSVIITGTIGDHGISIMAERSNLSFSRGLSSDSAPLNHMLKSLNIKFPESINFARDATRGGVASVLNEIVHNEDIGIKLIEENLPVKDEVKGVCEILGLDPLYSANEGKAILIVKNEDAGKIKDEMKNFEEGKDAEIIGEVTDEYPGKVFIETFIKGVRILPLLHEDQLPRIC
ncbi:MAG: hydrogenase expression/formation protein HypE [Acidobacteriota bacterium]